MGLKGAGATLNRLWAAAPEMYVPHRRKTTSDHPANLKTNLLKPSTLQKRRHPPHGVVKPSRVAEEGVVNGPDLH